MARKDSKRYELPDVTEYGSITSITKDYNKIDHGGDEYSDNTPLVGTVVDASSSL